MTPLSTVRASRRTIARPPEGPSRGHPTERSETRLPVSHPQALDLEAAVVTGRRGAGKTFRRRDTQRLPVRDTGEVQKEGTDA